MLLHIISNLSINHKLSLDYKYMNCIPNFFLLAIFLNLSHKIIRLLSLNSFYDMCHLVKYNYLIFFGLNHHKFLLLFVKIFKTSQFLIDKCSSI